MSLRIDKERAGEVIKEQDNILIIVHKNPDGDTLGSGFALMHGLRALGKNTAVICNDTIHERYGYMQPQIFSGEFEPTFIISVDVAGPQLFGENIAPYTKRINLAIDHHPSNTGFADFLWLCEDAAATAEMVYELLLVMDVPMAPIIADCIYTGIATDTGCFKFANTSYNTHLVAAEVIKAGADFGMLNNLLFERKSKKRIEIEKQALASLKYYFDERVASVCITKEQIEQLNIDDADLEGITSIPRMIEGVQVGITMRQLPNGSFKISVRTADTVDASVLCARLGGGGHKRAAGCELIGGAQNVIDALLSEVAREFEPVAMQ